jgi:hypothetical protein
MKQEPLEQRERELSQALARALEDVYVKGPDMKFEDLVKSYKLVEESFLPKVAGNEVLILETKRRVAELILYSALEKKCSFGLCERLFNEVVDLGFTNLEKKANVYMVYSRYCLQIGHNDEGNRLLIPLKAELEENIYKKDVLLYQHLLQNIQSLLRQFKSQE